MTQRDRVLHALQAAGARGVTQVDFMLPGVIDGGAPITRVAARIDELRRAGHQIVNVEWRQKCIVYRLEQPAVAPTPEPAQDASAELSLFSTEAA